MKAIDWILFAILVGISITGPLADNDLWWHLTIGRWIVGHGQLPNVELWNRFGFGHPFVPYSWSFELVVGLIEKFNGLLGVLVAQIALISLISIVLARIFSETAKDYFFGALVSAVVVSGFVAQYTIRPQSIVWLLFTIVVATALKIREEGLTKGRLISLAILFCAWANLHITTIIGLVTIGMIVFDRKKPKTFVLSVLVSILATFVTPHFGYEWIIFFSKSDHPLSLHGIAEFGAGTILDYPVGLLILLLSLFFLLLHTAARAVPVSLFLLIGTLSLAGLAIVKFIPFALVIAGFGVCIAWRAVRDGSDSSLILNLVAGLDRFRKILVFCSGPGLTFALSSLVFIKIYGIVMREPVSTSTLPSEAVDFILKENLPRPIMNSFGDGGFLMYKLSNSRGEVSQEDRVCIDGRTNINDPVIMNLSLEALNGGMGWSRFVDRINPATILWRNQSPLISILLASGSWCRVFVDGSYSLFISSQNEGKDGMPSCISEK